MSTRGNPHLIIRLDPAVKAEIEQRARSHAMDTSTFIRHVLASASLEVAPATPAPHAPLARRARRVSRLARFTRAHEELVELLSEYEAWYAATPEPLQDTPTTERVGETVEQLTQIIDLLAEVVLPRGFGRD